MNNIVCLDLSLPRKMIKDKINDIFFNYKMSSNKDNIKLAIKIAQGTFIITLALTCTPVAAAGVKEQIMKAFNPIVDVIQALGYPVCLSIMTAGGVTMAFNRKNGVRMIKDGAIAFLVIQFVPKIMSILVGVGEAMK